MLLVRLSTALAVCLLLASCSAFKSERQYVARGNQFLQQGKLAEAAINFRKALQKNPQSGNAYYGLGRVQAQQNLPAEAIQSFLRAHQLLKEREDIVATFANLCIELSARAPGSNKQLYDQLRALQQDSASDPKLSFQSARLEGYLALADHAPLRALEAFRRAEAIRPDQPEILFSLSQSLLQNEQGKEAEAGLQKLVAKHPDFSAAYDGLYVYYLAESRLEDAEQALKAKVAAFPRSADYLLQLSGHYWQFNKRQDAQHILDEMLSQRDLFPNAPLLVGRFYGDHLDWDNAIRVLREGERSSPKDPYAYKRSIAEAFIAQRRYEEAKIELDQILASTPADYEIRLKRADVLLQSGNSAYLQPAITEYLVLAVEKPKNSAVKYALGIAYLRQKNLDAAVSNLKMAVQQYPPYVPPRIALAEISLSRGQFLEALQYADEALGYDARSLPARQLKAVALMGLRRYAEARHEIGGLLKDLPGDPQALLDRAVLDMAEKRFSIAEAELRQIYRPGEADLRPMAALVDLLLTLHQTGAAQQIVDRELRVSGNSPSVRKTWAEALRRHAMLDSAIREYSGLATTSDRAEPLLQLAEIYNGTGRPSEALNAAEKAAARQPDDAKTLLYTGYMLEKVGKLQEAERTYRHALKIRPTDSLLMNNLASVLAAQGQSLDEARKLIEDALKQNPAAPEFRDTLASVYAKKRMYDSSIQILNGLVKQHPNEVSFRIHLASTLLEKGDRAAAEFEVANIRKGTIPKEFEASLNLLSTRLRAQ